MAPWWQQQHGSSNGGKASSGQNRQSWECSGCGYRHPKQHSRCDWCFKAGRGSKVSGGGGGGRQQAAASFPQPQKQHELYPAWKAVLEGRELFAKLSGKRVAADGSCGRTAVAPKDDMCSKEEPPQGSAAEAPAKAGGAQDQQAPLLPAASQEEEGQHSLEELQKSYDDVCKALGNDSVAAHLAFRELQKCKTKSGGGQATGNAAEPTQKDVVKSGYKIAKLQTKVQKHQESLEEAQAQLAKAYARINEVEELLGAAQLSLNEEKAKQQACIQVLYVGDKFGKVRCDIDDEHLALFDQLRFVVSAIKSKAAGTDLGKALPKLLAEVAGSEESDDESDSDDEDAYMRGEDQASDEGSDSAKTSEEAKKAEVHQPKVVLPPKPHLARLLRGRGKARSEGGRSRSRG